MLHMQVAWYVLSNLVMHANKPPKLQLHLGSFRAEVLQLHKKVCSLSGIVLPLSHSKDEKEVSPYCDDHLSIAFFHRIVISVPK